MEITAVIPCEECNPEYEQMMFLFVRAKDAICGPESGLAIELPNMTAVSGLYPG